MSGESEIRGLGTGHSRRPALSYVVCHPDVSYCDECLFDLTAQQTAQPGAWGAIGVERADGICARCKQPKTVSTGRRLVALAESPEPTPPLGLETPAAVSEQTPYEESVPHEVPPAESNEPRVMDLVMRALLMAKLDALKA